MTQKKGSTTIRKTTRPRQRDEKTAEDKDDKKQMDHSNRYRPSPVVIVNSREQKQLQLVWCRSSALLHFCLSCGRQGKTQKQVHLRGCCSPLVDSNGPAMCRWSLWNGVALHIVFVESARQGPPIYMANVSFAASPWQSKNEPVTRARARHRARVRRLPSSATWAKMSEALVVELLRRRGQT